MTGDDSRRSTPITAVHILLPVWGYKYIKQMLEFCIPTLLASGNIPSVAKTIRTKFVLLTREKDSMLVKDHPSWVELSRVCETEIRSIDDLVTRDNHTAVITLAFHRAIVEAGSGRNDICFVFMNSDFLVANNALKNVVDRIASGSSGVLAGNFQVAAEETAPLLRSRVDNRTRSLEMSPRDLLAFGFLHLHPATVANVVNLGIAHNASSNRLFWRVDANTLLGRFFLIHVVAVRPERLDEAPLSSYDYSFIPEMCPSGNVHLVQDSDEYVVIEMQPTGHEASEIRRGSLSSHHLAHSLSQWATVQHRANASKTIYFHSKEIPPAGEVAAQAERFVGKVMAELTTPPISYENHPYWRGSIVAHEERIGQPMTKEKWAVLINRSPSSIRRLIKRVFGAAPQVSIFHPAWQKYAVIIPHLRARGQARGLFVCHDPFEFSDWLLDQEEMKSFQIETLASLTRSQYLPLVGSIDFAFLYLSDATFRLGRSTIARIAPTLAPNGKLLVLVDGVAGVSALSSVLDIRLTLAGVHYRFGGRIMRGFYSLSIRLARRISNSFVLMVAAIPSAACIAVLNWLPVRKARSSPRSVATSVTLEMLRVGDEIIALPDDLDGPAKEHSASIDAAAALLAADEGKEVRRVNNLIQAGEIISHIVIDRGGG
jgi:hypothetical protein